MLPRRLDAAFQRDIPSRGTEVIYIFERRDTRGGAVFPATCVLVLMLRTDCSLFTIKSAHSSRLLPPAQHPCGLGRPGPPPKSPTSPPTGSPRQPTPGCNDRISPTAPTRHRHQ